MKKEQARILLQAALGDPKAAFRSGQWEAIDALVNQQQKLLVVQRTGWGKSSVYFISAKIFRNRGRGPTIIVSPLLSLMRNQIESAKQLDIIAETINSTNTKDWPTIEQSVLADEVDCLLISPERLANDSFIETVLQPISDRIALMVIDEAHCISDWGHDFRPDYRRIISILRQLPPNTPILGTTATANNRVVADIVAQLGNLHIQRGPLARDSLALQSMKIPDQASRLAWLAQIIPNLKGTGILYTLTTRDAEQVALWLSSNGIDAKAYYGDIKSEGFKDSDAYREHLEDLLYHNRLKVLVATTALGMGYDKPDLGFVIHYQAPSSIVAYYQQVGRAGRGIEQAVGILMSGSEDQDINRFFRESAFPPEDQIQEILQLLESCDGMKVRSIEANTNIRQGQINKTLKLLSVENPAPVIYMEKQWQRTPVPFTLDHDRIARLTRLREQEWDEMLTYLEDSSCKMSFLRRALDDHESTPCGKCTACIGKPIVDLSINPERVHKAASFLKHAEIAIPPKKQVASNAFVEYGFSGNLPSDRLAQEGRVLSRWGDTGWGSVVAGAKRAGHFGDDLVMAMAEMIRQRWQPNPGPQWVCSVPSRNHPDLVPNFAHRLALQLGIPFMDVVTKVKDNQLQKKQQNRFHQCQNLDGAFTIHKEVLKTPVLLVDDIVDSGWTLTVITALLRQAGSGLVFPTALASSSVKDS